MEREVVLLVGCRGHKIREPLSTTSLHVTEVYMENLAWDAKLKVVAKVYKYLLKKKVITMADYPGYIALIALIGSQLVSSPFVLRLRGDIWQDVPQWESGSLLWLRLAIADYITRNADIVICASKYLASQVVRRPGIQPEKIITIPIPVHQEVKQRRLDKLPSQIQELLKQLTDHYIILTVTNLDFKGKLLGLNDFLPIFDKVLSKRQDVLWVIAGSGRYLATFQKKVEQMPWLTEKIYLLGYVTPVAPLIDRADLIVYFSYEDGYPNVPLEAQVAGKSLIVNNYAPLLEQVQSGNTGFVVNPEHIDGTAELVCNLLDSPDLRSRIGEQARISVLQHHNKNIIGKMFENTLKGVGASACEVRS